MNEEFVRDYSTLAFFYAFSKAGYPIVYLNLALTQLESLYPKSFHFIAEESKKIFGIFISYSRRLECPL